MNIEELPYNQTKKQLITLGEYKMFSDGRKRGSNANPAYRCWSVPGLPRDNLFSLFLYVVWWQWHSDGRRQNLISTTPLYPSRLSSKQVIPTRTLRSMLFLLTPLEVSLPFSFLKNAPDDRLCHSLQIYIPYPEPDSISTTPVSEKQAGSGSSSLGPWSAYF